MDDTTPASRRADTAPASERVAKALREAPYAIDEVARARAERSLLEAWRTRGARAVPLPRSRALPRMLWISSLAGSAAVGLVVGLVLLRQERPMLERAPERLAHFELVLGDGAVQSGTLVAGQVLESGKQSHIEVGIGRTRIDIAPDSRVRFERLDAEELRLSLVQGRVDVAFNPEHKAGERLLVETTAARVVVIGTRFAVEAEAARATHVSVSEGIVRVEPRRGGPPLLVRAGERVSVPVQASVELRPGAAPAAPAIEAEADLDADADADVESASAAAPSRRAAARAPDHEARLEAARRLLLAGKHAAARVRLQRMIETPLPQRARVEALVLMAESYTAQGQVPRAAAAYREAVETAPRHAAGHNALFALARLFDRYTRDRDGAASAYREYLTRAPNGALAAQARTALCRLAPNSAGCD